MTTIAQNRKARHDYLIIEKVEAGIALQGSEVKSCRAGTVSLAEAYARHRDGELWLIGAHIAQYTQAGRNNHDPVRDRKLLLHRRQIRTLQQATEAKGLTLVPLRMYTTRHRIKVELALCRGKDVRDKRESLKRKMQERETQRALAGRAS